MPSADARPLPVAIEEITPQWLTAALSAQAPGLEVRGCEVVRMIRATCTKIWLRLDLNAAGRAAGLPDVVVLKGGFEPHSRAMGYMHEKEARAYRDLFPNLPLRTPACWFADYDAERAQGVVIMEDLNARGVTFCDPLEPQSHEVVARRLRALAAYHAASFASPDLGPGGRWDWVEHFPALQQGYFEHQLEPAAWARCMASPRGAAASVVFHDLGWMRQALARIAAVSASLPQAVIHGDTHLGNLYVEADGTPGFFDSLAGRAAPMLEVAYHLVCALDPADRRRWEGPLVQHYLGALREAGVEAPPFEAAMRQYAVFLAYAYSIFAINDSVFQPEAVNTAYVARISAAMLDNDTRAQLDALG